MFQRKVDRSRRTTRTVLDRDRGRGWKSQGGQSRDTETGRMRPERTKGARDSGREEQTTKRTQTGRPEKESGRRLWERRRGGGPEKRREKGTGPERDRKEDPGRG